MMTMIMMMMMMMMMIIIIIIIIHILGRYAVWTRLLVHIRVTAQQLPPSVT